MKVAVTCVGAVAFALGLGACGSSGKGTPTPKTLAPPGAVAIASFGVPAVKVCGPALVTKVPVSYAVDSARSQRVVVDGHVQSGTDAASGTIMVSVPCDNGKHTIALVAQGDQGHLEGRVKYVTTLRRPG
jgi:anti-sigma factor RsiW